MHVKTLRELNSKPVTQQDEQEWLEALTRFRGVVERARIPLTLDWLTAFLSFGAQEIAASGMPEAWFYDYCGSIYDAGASVPRRDQAPTPEEFQAVPATTSELRPRVLRLYNATLKLSQVGGTVCMEAVAVASQIARHYWVDREMWLNLVQAAYADSLRRVQAWTSASGGKA